MSLEPPAGEPGFTEAIRELEAILVRIEGEEVDVDRLAPGVLDGDHLVQ